MLKFGVIAASALALLSSAANATTYYLKDVVFTDGTKARGFFSTGVSGYPDDHNIRTQNGDIAGYHYIHDINVTYNPGDSSFTVYHAVPSYDGFLTITIGHSLDSITGDTALSLGGASFECSSYSCPNGVQRDIASGFLSLTPQSVPEPAQWALIIGGFGMAGGAMRRRRTTATVTA
jgi:hypothetical protein